MCLSSHTIMTLTQLQGKRWQPASGTMPSQATSNESASSSHAAIMGPSQKAKLELSIDSAEQLPAADAVLYGVGRTALTTCPIGACIGDSGHDRPAKPDAIDCCHFEESSKSTCSRTITSSSRSYGKSASLAGLHVSATSSHTQLLH